MNWLNEFLRKQPKNTQEYSYLEKIRQDFEKAYNNNKNNNFSDVVKNSEIIEKNNKTEYNKGENLNRYKSSTLFNQMMMKVKPNYVGEVILNDYNNYYLVYKDIDNGYDILEKIEISGNEEYIKHFEEEWNNDESRKSIDTNIKINEYEKRHSNVDNAEIKGQETWTEFIDRVLENNRQEQLQSDRFTKESGKDNTTIKNSKELDNSSFSLKEKQNEIIQKTNPMLDDYLCLNKKISALFSNAEIFE